MPDLSVPYVLTTGAGTITFNVTGVDLFNDFGADEFYISNITGLDGSPIRAPVDDRPQTDGGLVHPFFKGPRHPAIEGVLMIRSTRIGNSIRAIRNQMEEDLLDALESILQTDGTLAWTPAGMGARSLNVRYEVPLEFSGVELKAFTFGLVAGDPDW